LSRVSTAVAVLEALVVLGLVVVSVEVLVEQLVDLVEVMLVMLLMLPEVQVH